MTIKREITALKMYVEQTPNQEMPCQILHPGLTANGIIRSDGKFFIQDDELILYWETEDNSFEAIVEDQMAFIKDYRKNGFNLHIIQKIQWESGDSYQPRLLEIQLPSQEDSKRLYITFKILEYKKRYDKLSS